jgi:cytoskeletal protein RodZ
MNQKSRQKVAKWAAVIVMILMVFQVLLPLFSSAQLSQNTAANVTAETTPTDGAAAPATTATVEGTTVTATTTAPTAETTLPAPVPAVPVAPVK